MGLLTASAPVAAQAFGAANLRVLRRSLRMGLWAALLLSLPIMVLPLRGEQILLALAVAGRGAARPAISVQIGMGRGAGAMVFDHPQFHGRGQPTEACLVGDARRHPLQRHAGLSADVEEARTTAA